VAVLYWPMDGHDDTVAGPACGGVACDWLYRHEGPSVADRLKK